MTGAMAQREDGRQTRGTTMLHLAAIQALVEQIQRPIEEIAAVYQCELVQLGATATVTDFLPVLVAKRVPKSLSEIIRPRIMSACRCLDWGTPLRNRGPLGKLSRSTIVTRS